MKVKVRKRKAANRTVKVRIRKRKPQESATPTKTVHVLVMRRPVQSVPGWTGEMFRVHQLTRTGPRTFTVGGDDLRPVKVTVTPGHLAWWMREGLTLTQGGGKELWRHINPRDLFPALKRAGLWKGAKRK
jgi:hypothetical protein